MKNFILSIICLFTIGFYASAQDLSPYFKVGESSESINEVSNKVISALETSGFTILGKYNPAGSTSLKVVAFTNNKLKNTVIKVKDRGALAAVIKVGMQLVDGKVVISYNNPEYLLRAYLMDDYKTYESVFVAFSNDVKNALSSLGNEFSPFGGTVKAKELKKYHYKIMMPYFTDPVELAEFDSFQQGVNIIETNLKAKKGDTKLVYSLVFKGEKVAVYGIGLQNSEEGESYFLPKIGEAHVAALPYEIILQDNVATMLHGKYRIALHWPDLTMGTFMKIMSTPGDIEDALEAVCE